MPFDGDNQDVVFNKIKAGKFNINVDLSEECKDLLKKMIMVDVNKRINIEDAINHQWIAINKKQNYQDSKLLNPEVIQNLKKFRGSSTLKKAAVNILVKHLDHNQLQSLKEEFEKIDTDFSGFIELKELETIMKSSGQHLSHSEINQII
jgi:serine/threonine protein kinase